MKSRRTKTFRKLLEALPGDVQKRALSSYRAWRHDVWASRFEFKQVHPSKPFYSVRVNYDYRALGIRNGDEVTWFWIGHHSVYDKLVNQL